jgi:hypothetical protein
MSARKRFKRICSSFGSSVQPRARRGAKAAAADMARVTEQRVKAEELSDAGGGGGGGSVHERGSIGRYVVHIHVEHLVRLRVRRPLHHVHQEHVPEASETRGAKYSAQQRTNGRRLAAPARTGCPGGTAPSACAPARRVVSGGGGHDAAAGTAPTSRNACIYGLNLLRHLILKRRVRRRLRQRKREVLSGVPAQTALEQDGQGRKGSDG